MLKLNLPPEKIKMQKQELQELMIYLNKCSRSGFAGSNYYGTVNREREYFFRWHLFEFTCRVANKLLALSRDKGSKQVTITVYEPEQYALSAMFKRVDTNPYMLSLQSKFINGLTPMK